MDYIHIDNLSFKDKHGYFDQERRVEQEFAITLKLGVDLGVAGASDNLADTVDYQEIKDSIAAIIAGTSRYLIEKLAEDIVTNILEDIRIQSAEVTIKKTAVWGNGVPGVTILRTQQ